MPQGHRSPTSGTAKVWVHAPHSTYPLWCLMGCVFTPTPCCWNHSISTPTRWLFHLEYMAPYVWSLLTCDNCELIPSQWYLRMIQLLRVSIPQVARAESAELCWLSRLKLSFVGIVLSTPGFALAKLFWELPWQSFFLFCVLQNPAEQSWGHK